MNKEQAKLQINTALNDLEALITEFVDDHHYDKRTTHLLVQLNILEEAIDFALKGKTIQPKDGQAHGDYIAGVDFSKSIDLLDDLFLRIKNNPVQ